MSHSHSVRLRKRWIYIKFWQGQDEWICGAAVWFPFLMPSSLDILSNSIQLVNVSESLFACELMWTILRLRTSQIELELWWTWNRRVWKEGYFRIVGISQRTWWRNYLRLFIMLLELEHLDLDLEESNAKQFIFREMEIVQQLCCSSTGLATDFIHLSGHT